MAIEVFTLYPQPENDDPVIAEIAIPHGDMAAARDFLSIAAEEERQRAAGTDREYYYEQLSPAERAEAYVRHFTLADAEVAVVRAMRADQPVVRPMEGFPPKARSYVFYGLIRGIEQTAHLRAATHDTAPHDEHRALVARHIRHTLMTASDYKLDLLTRPADAATESYWHS